MTYRERFFSYDGKAPSTIGTPGLLHTIDRTCFKKSDAEKAIAKDIKNDHKKELVKAYGVNFKKQLNVPTRTITGRIVNQF